ncbi:latent-transforming growth factor beta-binding protein 3-like [Chiloscyllium plagiosum]|uniref:latent-transforming growth factor beta-binding protein 3-like n=1 Tax=Chiloscyllium plagiosum TaxID=36176 RepID=UPI001CB80074|nr:latent-transforming growth factor beta-binding protein 3-like [Chiloscyllium plagiosum]
MGNIRNSGAPCCAAPPNMDSFYSAGDVKIHSMWDCPGNLLAVRNGTGCGCPGELGLDRENCSCPEGFRLINAPWQCIDVDECTFGGQCHREQGNQCINTMGSYSCICQAGFKQQGGDCVDVNECEHVPPVCEGHAVCENVPGGYRCSCQSGFRGNGSYCEDDNECASGQHGCDTNARCGNIIGSYFCQCYQGFNGDGFSCFDIDECSVNNGQCQQVCVNEAGSFKCQCNKGYTLTEDSKTCADFDECVDENAGCSQICTNTNGSYTCSCSHGYQLHVDMKQCVAVSNQAHKHSVAISSISAFKMELNVYHEEEEKQVLVNPID